MVKKPTEEKPYLSDGDDEGSFNQEENDDEYNADLRGKSLKNTLHRKPKERKEVLPLKSIMQQILDKPENSSQVGLAHKKSILFSKKKMILKKVLKERKNAKLVAIKNHLKKKSENMGKVLPNYSRVREYERNLKMITVEGSKHFLPSYQAVQYHHTGPEEQDAEPARRDGRPHEP